jgi:hypothetical protein
MNKKFTAIFTFLAGFFLLLAVSPLNVYADLFDTDFLGLKCAPGEKEVVCSYKSEEPFGPRTEDNCKEYKNNSNYYFLVSTGSSFGGEEKYCLYEGRTDENILNSYSPAVVGGVISVVVGASLLGIFLIRKRNAAK